MYKLITIREWIFFSDVSIITLNYKKKNKNHIQSKQVDDEKHNEINANIQLLIKRICLKKHKTGYNNKQKIICKI